MSINAFLERIDELKDARNATDEDLWRYAIDLFQNDALIWFRANRAYVTDWGELVIMLRRTFQKPFYQEELLEEIRRRNQGIDESVMIFISVMQNMFNRLQTQVSESFNLNIILKKPPAILPKSHLSRRIHLYHGLSKCSAYCGEDEN